MYIEELSFFIIYFRGRDSFRYLRNLVDIFN